MTGTINTGNIGTEEFLPDERMIDMDENIKKVSPDDTQFTTMSSRLSSRSAIREKVNWLEEDDFPRIVTNVGAQIATDTTLTLQAGQGVVVAANDILRNMRSGEAVRVVSVAVDVVTVARGIGNIPAAAVNAADVWLDVADAQPQGSDFPTPRYLARVLGFNYTEITRTTWAFTNTATSIGLYGGREPAKEAVRQARIHKRKWEAIGFFGARSFSAAVPPENEPRGTAGGAIEFIQTYKTDANGVLTPDVFDSWIMGPMQWGSEDKVFFCSPLVASAMSKWNRSGMGSQWEPTPDDVHGVKVNAFISGAYGYRVPVVVKKEWGQFPTANKGYGSYGFLLDMSLIERRPLQDRDTKLLTEEQPKGKDTYAAEYICEATYEFAIEKAHGILYGVTG